MFCGRMTRKVGKVGLGYLLNHHGMVKGEATLANIDDGTIWYGSAAASEYHDMDWLTAHMPKDGSVSIRSLTNDHTILVLAGPKSRDVLAAASRGDWSATAFPWLSVRRAFVGIAPAVVMSVSFSGELAYEIHVPNAQLYAAYLALRKAGEAHGLRLFGSYAVESMRMEKGYRHWKADLVTEFTPFESSLGRFVKMDKPHFIGKAALEKMIAEGHRRAFVSMVLDATHATAHGGDAILCDGRVVGSVTSVGWGHRVGKNIAMGFVEPAFAAEGTALMVEVIGVPTQATVVPECLYDPENLRVRA
jgi:dimethylglycine dehydrogenase